MFDPAHLLNILHANNINPSSSEEEIRNFLKNLKWPENDINDSIKHLERNGWFVVKNPFLDSSFAKGSLYFRIREYLKYLNIKLFKKRVYIDDPLKKPPVFNNMNLHLRRVLPPKQETKAFFEGWMLSYFVSSIIKYTLLLVTILCAIYLLDLYSGEIITKGVNLLFPE